ncbi:MAG: cation diffusion facilitator family transporter [Pseudomonadales bacterium]|nr:cation diffusion facilitator family transporter [Pseudomonadales bacterium]
MSSSSSKKVIIAALIGNSLVSLCKFAAAIITGSSAMFSEGIHSVVDTGNQVLLLYGLKQAQKPPDDLFPFGHGKEVYFWSFVVAILIFGIGAGISIYEGIGQILNPHAIKNAMVNYIVLGLALVIEGAAWYMAFREFSRSKGSWTYLEAVKRGKDPSVFLILFEDSAAMLGLLIAALGVYLSSSLGYLWLDGVASVCIGLVLAGTATWLAIETKGLLIGERANLDTVNGIRTLCASYNGVEKVHEVLTMHMGPEFILVNISVKFKDNATAVQIESSIEDIDKAIKSRYEHVKRIFIEAERSSMHT